MLHADLMNETTIRNGWPTRNYIESTYYINRVEMLGIYRSIYCLYRNGVQEDKLGGRWCRDRGREREILLLLDPSIADTSILTTKEIMHFSILAWTPISIV